MKITFTMDEIKDMVRSGAIEFRYRSVTEREWSAHSKPPVYFFRADGSEVTSADISRVEIEL